MKKKLIFMGAFLFVQIFPAELTKEEQIKRKELLSPLISSSPSSSSSSDSSNGRGIRRTLSGKELKNIQKERAEERKGKKVWYFRFPKVTISEFATEYEIEKILSKLQDLWDNETTRPTLKYLRYSLSGTFPQLYDRSRDGEYEKILFEKGLIKATKLSKQRLINLVCQAALSEPEKLFTWKDLTKARIIISKEERAKKIEVWYFNLPNQRAAKNTSEFDIKSILTTLWSIWEDEKIKPAIEYLRYLLKGEFPKAYNLKNKNIFDNILIKNRLITSINPIKFDKFVGLVCQAALLEPEKLLTWKELINKKIIQSENAAEKEKQKIKEYEPNGELFVFQLPERTEEFQTSDKSIKKIYEQFLKLKSTERVLFEKILIGFSEEIDLQFKDGLKKIGLMNEDGSIPYLVRYLWKTLQKSSDFEGEIKLMTLDEAFDQRKIYKKK